VRSAVDEAVAQWHEELRKRSPTALAIASQSFDADRKHIAGLSTMGMRSPALSCDTDEEKEGVRAFEEKCTPSFPQLRR
jgi:2-ketocyclohexanecarboxyl-CoA hydrolase